MVKGEESFTAIRARVDSNGRKRKERGKGKGKGGKSIFLFLDIGETRGGCTRPVGRREERQEARSGGPFFPSIVFPGGAKKRGGWEEGGCQPGHKLRPPDPCVSLGGGKGKGADGQGITGNRGG